MYLITMQHPDRHESDNESPYRGAVCVMAGRPWYVTGKVGPDLFGTPEAADDTFLAFPRTSEGMIYKVLSVEEYIKLVGDYPNPWLDELRTLCPKPVPPPDIFANMWVDNLPDPPRSDGAPF